ncbi:MAG: hypothetical protein AB7L90_25775 [Hyphomicrobiaceae bacterium]
MIDVDKLEALSIALEGRRWSWWDSNSFRRLTFVERSGWHGQDGGALHATVSRHDGHPDVQMAPGVREFIEEANPAVVLELIAEIGKLRRICAESYQVVGWLAEECGAFEHRQVQKALDNLAQHKLIHEDVLPFHPEDVTWTRPLCESRKVVLHIGQGYRFVPDPDCESCMRMKREHDEAYKGASL